MFRSTEADSSTGYMPSATDDAESALAWSEAFFTAPASRYTCGAAYPVTVATCAGVRVSVTVALLPVEETVALLSETPPVVPAPSLIRMLDSLTSASPDFTALSIVSVSARVVSSSAAPDSAGTGFVTVIALAILTLSALPPSVTAPALRCRCGVDMPCTLVTCWAVSVAVPAVPDTASVPVTSVPEL